MALSFLAVLGAWAVRSSIPSEVKLAALGVVFYTASELLWLVIKYVGYTDKTLDQFATGYDSKTGAKIVKIDPEQAKRLREAMEAR